MSIFNNIGHPGTKILMLRNLITDYCASGFSAGQARRLHEYLQ